MQCIKRFITYNISKLSQIIIVYISPITTVKSFSLDAGGRTRSGLGSNMKSIPDTKAAEAKHASETKKKAEKRQAKAAAAAAKGTNTCFIPN